MGLHRLFFSLIIHLAINNVPRMHYQPIKWQNAVIQHGRIIKTAPHMRPTTLSNSLVQHSYFDNDHPEFPGHFKGMEITLCECGLYPKTDLRAQCEGFKYVDSNGQLLLLWHSLQSAQFY